VISHTVTITLQVPVDTTALADRYGNARPGGPAALVAQIIAGSLLDATADMYGALVDLTAAQNGGA
jgi:hypothetical protein